MAALGMRPLCDKVQINGINGEFCFKLYDEKKLCAFLDGRVVHVAGNALAYLESCCKDVMAERLYNIASHHQITFLDGKDPVLKIDFPQQALPRNRLDAFESKGDEGKLPENVNDFINQQSKIPTRPDDPNQSDITACTTQIIECVEATDGGGILEAIIGLSRIPSNKITNPLTPLRRLIKALSSDDAIFMDRRVKLEIAKQLRPFLHLVYVKNKEQMVKGNLCETLNRELQEVLDLLDKNSIYKGHIEDALIRCEVEIAKACIDNLRKTSDEKEKVDFAFDLIQGASELISLINPIQAAVSAVSGIVGVVQGLVTQDTDVAGITGVVAFLNKKRENAQKKEWYERIVMLDLYKRTAIYEIGHLEWLQKGLIQNNLKKDWQFDCAVVLALSEIIQQTSNPKIRDLAWLGTGNKDGLCDFISYNGIGPFHKGIKMKLITARCLQEIKIVRGADVSAAVEDAIKRIRENIQTEEGKRGLDAMDPAPIEEFRELLKKGFRRRLSKEERAIEELRVSMKLIEENLGNVDDQIRNKLPLLAQTGGVDLSKRVERLNQILIDNQSYQEQSKKLFEEIANQLTSQKAIAGALSKDQEWMKGGIAQLIQDQKGPELLNLMQKIQGELNSHHDHQKALAQVQTVVNSLDLRVADVLKAIVCNPNGPKIVEQLKSCSEQQKKTEEALIGALKDTTKLILAKQEEMEKRLIEKMDAVYQDLSKGQRVLEENQKVIQEHLKALVEKNPQLQKNMEALQAGVLKYHVDNQKLLRNISHLAAGQKSMQKTVRGLDLRNQNALRQQIQGMQASLQGAQSKEAQAVLKSLQTIDQTMEKNQSLVTATFEKGQKEILEGQKQIHEDLTSSMNDLKEGQLQLGRALEELSKSVGDNKVVLGIVVDLQKKQFIADTKLDQFSQIYLQGQESGRLELQNILKAVESYQQSASFSVRQLVEESSKQKASNSVTTALLQSLQQGFEKEGHFIKVVQENLVELSAGQERLARIQDNLSHFTQEVREEVRVLRNMVDELQTQSATNGRTLEAIQQFTKNLKEDQSSIKGYLEGVMKELLQQKEEKQKKIEELRLLEEKIEKSQGVLREDLSRQVFDLQDSLSKKSEQEEANFQKVSLKLMDMSKGQIDLFRMVAESVDQRRDESAILADRLGAIEEAIRRGLAKQDPDEQEKKVKLDLASRATMMGDGLFDGGKFEEAYTQYQIALSLRKEILKESDPELVGAYRNVRLCKDRLAQIKPSAEEKKANEVAKPEKLEQTSGDIKPEQDDLESDKELRRLENNQKLNKMQKFSFFRSGMQKLLTKPNYVIKNQQRIQKVVDAMHANLTPKDQYLSDQVKPIVKIFDGIIQSAKR